MQIGTVARQVGVTVETIRFYEKRGLLVPPGRSASGYRQYPDHVIPRLRFITRAKELGFSLKEIKELIRLQSEPDATCGEVKRQAESKMADIDQKIADLQSIRETLARLVSSCPGRGPLSVCPILKTEETETGDD